MQLVYRHYHYDTINSMMTLMMDTIGASWRHLSNNKTVLYIPVFLMQSKHVNVLTN